MARGGSSNRWLERQRRDPYARSAREQGLRARSAFKLIDLDARFRLLRPGSVIVDLGAAPGGFTEAAARQVGRRGRVVACDLLPMRPVAGSVFVQGDFTDADVLGQVLQAIGGRPVDLVLSDMAPNLSGVRERDRALSMDLAESAGTFATQVLRRGGALVVKMFHCDEAEQWVRDLAGGFDAVHRVRPPATRSASSEFYCVAIGRRAAPPVDPAVAVADATGPQRGESQGGGAT